MAAEDYRRHAAECLRMAEQITEPGGKAVMIDMARSWLRLAEQAETNRLNDIVYETPPHRVRRAPNTATFPLLID
jgi:hypothetical protein